MRNLFFLLLLCLYSCGGGKGAPATSGTTSANDRLTYQGESVECLDKQLGFKNSRPKDLREMFDKIEESEIEECKNESVLVYGAFLDSYGPINF